MSPAILLAVLMAQGLTPPALERWVEVAATGGRSVAADPQSVHRAGDRASLIVRVRLPEGDGSGAPAIAVVRYGYDCVRNTVTRETSDVYGADGRFLGSSGAGSRRDAAIPPTSLQATLRDLACGTETTAGTGR